MWELHGLKNCDTCRKALKWLAAEGVDHRFSDIRKDTPDDDVLKRWAATVGLERLINRRGTTWRALSEMEREAAGSEKGAIPLMRAHPALIKRPVFQKGDRVLIGFDDTVRAALKD